MEYYKRLNIIKQQSVNRIFYSLLILVAFATPLSLSRWLTTGFLPIYTIHIVVFLTALILFFQRRRVPIIVMETFLIFCSVTIGLGTTWTFGISANTASMFMFLLLVTSIRRTKSELIGISGLYLAVVTLIAYLFTTGYLVPQVDHTIVLSQPVTWISHMLIMAVAGYAAIDAILKLNEVKLSLLNNISQQKLKIEYLANHDNLTGLLTLRVANDRLKAAISRADRNQEMCFLLFLDLDGFKLINDTYGHDVGDIVIQTVAQRMLEVTRQTDSCCRIGGDEFLIILPGVKDRELVIQICQRIINEIVKPIIIRNTLISVGVSIGGANYPNDACDSDSLKKISDMRMYKIKETGKNNFSLCG